MRWYAEDNWTGRVHSMGELVRLADRDALSPAEVRSRFWILPEATCRLLEQVERTADPVDTAADRRNPPAGS